MSMLIQSGQKYQEAHTRGLMKEHCVGGTHSAGGMCSPIFHCALGVTHGDLANLSPGVFLETN